jgi:hypothetical protein
MGWTRIWDVRKDGRTTRRLICSPETFQGANKRYSYKQINGLQALRQP